MDRVTQKNVEHDQIRIRVPIDYKKYAPNWLDEIRPKIMIRENYMCKFCKRKHKKYYFKKQYPGETELDEFTLKFSLDNNVMVTRVILTIAHLDHNPQNNDESNLAALCQRCHLNWDRVDNLMKRKANKANKDNNQVPTKKTKTL